MDRHLWHEIDSRFRNSDVSGATKLLEARLAEGNVGLPQSETTNVVNDLDTLRSIRPQTLNARPNK